MKTQESFRKAGSAVLCTPAYRGPRGGRVTKQGPLEKASLARAWGLPPHREKPGQNLMRVSKEELAQRHEGSVSRKANI